jgi:hypothetical protein
MGLLLSRDLLSTDRLSWLFVRIASSVWLCRVWLWRVCGSRLRSGVCVSLGVVLRIVLRIVRSVMFALSVVHS